MASLILKTKVTPESCKKDEWIKAVQRLKLKERTCKVFTPQEINKNLCVCNRQHSVHVNTDEPDLTNALPIWKWKDHTADRDAKCFSTLPQSDSPYLRCDMGTNRDQICLVLLGIWGIHPKMLIHMIGDSTSPLNIKLEEELLKGISHAAEASDACIITSCYKEDNISQIIGEVTYKSRLKNSEMSFRSIGIGKWGNIRDRPTAEKKNNDDNTTTNTTHSLRSGRKTLESNLTHYIFFDDGTHDSIDNGKFALALAKEISRGARRKIPLVATLVGGNLYAMELVYEYLENKTPVVIVDQSGPLANELCRYLKLTEKYCKTSKDNNHELSDEDESDAQINNDPSITQLLDRNVKGKPLREILNNFGKLGPKIIKDVRKFYEIIRQEEYAVIGKRLPMDELLNIKEANTVAKYVFWFATCLLKSSRELIYIYDYNSITSFQNTIYNALIKEQDILSENTNKRIMSADDRIELACRWKIVDITETHLQNVSLYRNNKRGIQNYRNLILNALTKSRETSPILLNNLFKTGIDFTILLTKNDGTRNKTVPENFLNQLYYIAVSQHFDEMDLLNKVDRNIESERKVNLAQLLEILVGDFMKPIYQSESSTDKQTVQEPGDKNIREYLYRDLFLWCIFSRQLNLAKVFLSQMKIRLCSALIATKILKSFIKYAPDARSQDQLSSEADDFENIAIECIRCSYSYDHGQACELIMRRIDMYGEITCLHMAIAADDKKFLHEDACQALLTNIWYDKIDPAQEHTRLIVNLLTMGLSQIGFSIKDKQKEKTDSKATNRRSIKRPLKKSGINYTDDYHNDESIYRHLVHFHDRPIVKYFYTCFGYALFLLFFSYFLLYSFDPISEDKPSIHWTEILTIIIVASMLFEEFRQFYSQDDFTWKSKFRTYFDLNNRMSNLFLAVPSYVLFVIALILRFVLTDPEEFSAARIVMAYDLELWFVRSILFIGIAPNLGPKLVMIRKLTNDLMFFVFLILIVIFAYGITSRAMIAYGTLEFDGRNFFFKVIYPVYYFVLGSFDNELQSLDETPDAGTTIATHVMFAFHMLFVNILLVNLLIALFAYTMDNVQEKAKYVWAYDRCSLVREYYARPPLFPPFTFITFLWHTCCSKHSHDENQQSRHFKMIPSESSLDDAWSEFERYSTNDYIRRLIDTQIMDSFQKTSINRSEMPSDFNHEFNRLNDTLMRTRLDMMQNSTLSSRIDGIENRLDEMMDSLDWMMKAMERVRMYQNPPIMANRKSASNNNLKEATVGTSTTNADIRIRLDEIPDSQETS